MVVSITCLHKLNTNPLSNLRAILCFPKVILLENNKNIHIVDIYESNDSDKNFAFLFENEISEFIVRDKFIWCLLKSGEIWIINIDKGYKIKIIYNSQAHYNIVRLRKQGPDLILISESGECLNVIINNEDLEKNIQELTVSLTKYLPKIQDHHEPLYIKSDELIFKCPHTGLTDVIKSNVHLDFIRYWDDMIVLSHSNKMWAMNKSFELIFQFDKNNSNYHPMSANKGIFYYLKWINGEVMFVCYKINIYIC